MSLIERTIQLSFQHRVYFTRHAFGVTNGLLRDLLLNGRSGQAAKALVVLDESLHRAQPNLAHSIEAYFSAFGERLELVCPPIILEGGGALLDVAGLAAATAHRGVRHVRIPTTTLSQADSGVGVKNGINAFGKKNFIGTFAPPYAVINDFQLLASLSPRDKRAGYAEAVKVALIRDAAFFQAIEGDAQQLRHFEPEAMQRLIYRCAELHVNHIATAGDPFEAGSAR